MYGKTRIAWSEKHARFLDEIVAKSLLHLSNLVVTFNVLVAVHLLLSNLVVL